MHGIEIPWFFDCLEVWEAYEKAHKAGKTKHFGFSTHNHVKEVMAAAAEADQRGPWKIDLIMPAVNPVSFADPAPELNYKAELRELKKRDIGIIAMKTTGIKGRFPDENWMEKAGALGDVAKLHDEALKKLWMLNFTGNLVDGVIAAMKNEDHVQEDLSLPQIKLSAEAARELKAIVKMSMAGRCHLCGDCSTVCPEQIAVTDMIRYHAYVHQYDEKELARELYAQAGYDPARLCNNCGKCIDVCPSQIPIPAMLHELSADMA
jgi:predicted aldo/keto reductase-like oxidoreductase